MVYHNDGCYGHDFVAKELKCEIQGRVSRAPVPRPPRFFFMGKITGANDFVAFSRETIWTGGSRKKLKMPSTWYRPEIAHVYTPIFLSGTALSGTDFSKCKMRDFQDKIGPKFLREIFCKPQGVVAESLEGTLGKKIPGLKRAQTVMYGRLSGRPLFLAERARGKARSLNMLPQKRWSRGW